MAELINKWEVVSKLITLQNNYNFFRNEWDAERLYREIAKLEIGIGKTSGIVLVHCKDCKHWADGVAGCTEHIKCCKIGFYMVGENGYCVYGERRTDE